MQKLNAQTTATNARQLFVDIKFSVILGGNSEPSLKLLINPFFSPCFGELTFAVFYIL